MRNGKLMTKRLVAIALSSMMAMSMGLTAFASGDYTNQREDPEWGDSIQTDAENYLVGDSVTKKTKTRESAVGMKDAEGNIYSEESWTEASFMKTISLYNLINNEFVPSVPDVNFQYTIAPVTIPGGKETTDKNSSYAGANIYSGIAGVVDGSETKVIFSHATDDPANDYDEDPTVMSKLGTFKLNDELLQGKDIGVYRYVLIESDAAMNEGVAPSVLGSIDDIADYGKARILDIILSKVSPDPSDNARAITGVIMHDIDSREGELKHEGDAWTVSWVDKETKSKGFTPYSMDKYTGEKNDDWYTKYTTFDLVIGKELTGKGLDPSNDADEFTFEVSLKAPNGTKIKVVKSNDAKVSEDWTIKENNELKQSITIKGSERFQFSGLPAGATYSLKETDSKDYTAVIYKKNVADLAHDAAKGEDRKFIEIDNAKVVAKDAEGKDVTAKVDFNRKVVAAAKESGEIVDEAIKRIAKTDDIQNAFVVNQLDPVTVTGVVMNVAPYALMVIAAAIFAGLFISKKRQEEEI